MRRTAWTDIFRLIGGTKRFFITLTAVIALAVMGYTGISFATVSLCRGCEQYYDASNFYDLQLGSIYGFSAEELSLVQSDPRVNAAEATYTAQELITVQGDSYVAEFYTAPETLNRAQLRQGRWLRGKDECVIEEALAERFDLKVGDAISLRDPSSQLDADAFTIVGTADLVTVFVTDDYYNRGASELGDGQVATKIMVSSGVFSESTPRRVCYISVNDRPARGSEEYYAYVDELSADLTALLEEPEQKESLRVKADTGAKLSEAEESYAAGIQAFEDAEAQFTAARDTLAAQQQQLAEKQEQLVAARAALAEQDATLTRYEAELDAARDELDAAKAQLNNTLQGLSLSSRLRYQASETEYSKNTALLKEKRAAFEDTAAQLTEGEKQLAAARVQLSEAQTALGEKKAELSEKRDQLAEMRGSLDETHRLLESFPDGRVYGMTILSNPSYQYYSKMTSNSSTITTVLCILLLAIATLVCFTTISRMITEQHRLVGTQKALGFRNREICGKYLIYVLFCTILGSGAGLLCSYAFLQQAVFTIGYGKAFLFQEFHPIILWRDTLFLVVGEVLILSSSAVLACHQILHRSAIDLLNSNIRSEGKLRRRERERLPLSLRMTLRNLRSNPQICLTTVISVFGCTVLLIVVLTVRNSMAGIAPRQFHDLQNYDGILTAYSDASAEDFRTLDKIIRQDDGIDSLRVKEKYIAYEQDEEMQYATMICLPSDSSYRSFLRIIDGDSGKILALSDDGIWICQKLSENRRLSVGDSLTIRDVSGKEHVAKIAGIFDRNIGMAVICSTNYYTELMGESAVLDQYYIRGDRDSIEALLSKVRDLDAYCGYADAKYYESEMAFKIRSVNSAVLLILAITFFLSLFVLSNLSHMNIKRKEREIVIMKVQGFPRKRVLRYIFWESMAMCIIGLLIGVVSGGPLGSMIARSIEMESLKDIRGINLAACGIGGGVQILFFTLSNLLSLRQVNRIKMTGSAREA